MILLVTSLRVSNGQLPSFVFFNSSFIRRICSTSLARLVANFGRKTLTSMSSTNRLMSSLYSCAFLATELSFSANSLIFFCMLAVFSAPALARSYSSCWALINLYSSSCCRSFSSKAFSRFCFWVQYLLYSSASFSASNRC